MATEHYEVLVAVHARIAALGLRLADNSVLPAAQCRLQKLPFDRKSLTDSGHGLTLPAVLVTLSEGMEEIGEGSKEHDDIGYPVQVTMAFASNQNLTLDETPLRWRKRIRRAFQDKTLAGANGVEAWDCQVTPQLIISASLFQQANIDVGALLIRCWVNEDRFERGLNE